MRIALLIALALGLGTFGVALWRLTPREERRRVLGCLVMTLPMCWLMFHFVRIPIDKWLAAKLGESDFLSWIRTAYAPLTEEPAKLWPLALPWVRKAITRDNIARFALALGLGFALGEMVTVADLITVRKPDIASLPWHQLGGFIQERLMTCAIHGGMTALALVMWRRRSSFALGLLLAMLAHYLANFPISMRQWGWLGANANVSMGVVSVWVILCFFLSLAGLAWLQFGPIRLALYGRALCPGCGTVYDRSAFFGLNMGTSLRYERCPHCRKWHTTTALHIMFLGIIAAIVITGMVSAADVPAQPLAKKGALIFSDDFSTPEVGKAWREQWPALTIADGALNISQVKPEHSAVGLVPVGKKDVVIEFKFKLGGAKSINAVCNDRDFKEGHAGHICRVSLTPRQIFLADDKERLTHEIEAMKKDPARKAEVAKLVAGRSVSIPTKLDPSRWYQLAIEIVGDEMRVSLDGKAIGYLKSSGLAHPMKSDFYFAVSGKDALFDDMHIWDAK
ncbi:MAG: hypothetical protein JWR15_4131 [Prosthecobacter sp.]|nr:hypothetical protein [Prosthecobacter sp.]